MYYAPTKLKINETVFCSYQAQIKRLTILSADKDASNGEIYFKIYEHFNWYIHL